MSLNPAEVSAPGAALANPSNVFGTTDIFGDGDVSELSSVADTDDEEPTAGLSRLVPAKRSASASASAAADSEDDPDLAGGFVSESSSDSEAEGQADEYMEDGAAKAKKAPKVKKAKKVKLNPDGTPRLPSFKKKRGEARSGSVGTPESRERSGSLPGPATAKPKKKRKSKKATEVVVEDEMPLTDEQRRQREIQERLDAIIKAGSKKITNKRRAKDDEDLDEEGGELVLNLRQDMLLAAQQDADDNIAGRIASARLAMLPRVTQTYAKNALSILVKSFFDANLYAFTKWLEPLPGDKSLPTLNVMRALFDIIWRLPIETEHLKESELGKIVLFYSKCPRVPLDVRRKAQKLVNRWMRPIIRSSAQLHRNVEAAQQARPIKLASQKVRKGRVPTEFDSFYSIAPQTAPDVRARQDAGSKSTGAKYRDIKRKIAANKAELRRG
ncbi:hypothetical protein E5Q_02105 [Mixia osmundae IAM 14324]|uniref:TFIIS N-terminal domain-containing protein n=1 Tax=Mixia osmundae (strain CBS 9802 / IAM 14324 / JCM 22182 / KY 12970) TaxID=764103 RepID=G7DXZ1_MIXOS|nr:hypothetical protein E5Q_02105 [Mixia osmundae IAM 14324]